MASIGYGYGSEWHLLQYLGRRRHAFTQLVQTATKATDIRWLDSEAYVERKTGWLRVRELRGLEFLQPTDPVRQNWERAWPQSGNVHNWDAVGHATAANRTAWLLVEAKAHLGELTSSCTATADDSILQIQKVLDDARRDLEVATDADWSKEYYQRCNRVALLNFLVKKGVEAHLLFVYLTGDRTDIGTAGRECPASQSEWQEALNRQDQYVGLPPTSPIRERIHSLFVPAYRVNVAEQVLKGEYIRREKVR